MIIYNKQSLDAHVKELIKKLEDGPVKVEMKSAKSRSLTMNSALHQFCKMLAHVLNDAGFDFRVFIKEGYPVPFNEYLVKEYLWRPIQKAITGKDSTTKPTNAEYSEIYEALNMKLSEFGIHVPWPSKDNMQCQQKP